MTKWKIKYDNATGPSDEGFSEWWDVTDGERSFRSTSEHDAQCLLSVLNKSSTTPKMSAEEYEKRREKVGTTRICRRIHEAMKCDKFDRKRILGDIAFLQRKLTEWGDSGTHYGRAVKSLVVAVLAEAAVHSRLTIPAASTKMTVASGQAK